MSWVSVEALRQTERQPDGRTDRQTDKQTDFLTDRDRDRDRQLHFMGGLGLLEPVADIVLIRSYKHFSLSRSCVAFCWLALLLEGLPACAKKSLLGIFFAKLLLHPPLPPKVNVENVAV